MIPIHERQRETRYAPIKVGRPTVETRTKDGKGSGDILKGKAAVFDEFAEITNRFGDTFMEKFSKDCMNETLADGHKVMALFNHDWSCLMGSTADNLTLVKKDDGLYFELTTKGFDLDRRITELVRSGTIDACSIGFQVTEDVWRTVNGMKHRLIEKIELHEITLTPIPAYERTSVEACGVPLDNPRVV